MSLNSISQEQRLAHVAQWRASGVTRSAYCVQHGLKLRSFIDWIKRSRELGDGDAKLTLIQGKVAKVLSPQLPAMLVLECPNGSKLHLPSNTSASWLGALLGALS